VEGIPGVSPALAAIEVDAATAGGRVWLRLKGVSDLRVTISEGYYAETDEATIGADLARAVRLLMARRQAAVDELGAASRHPLVRGSRLADEIDSFNRQLDEWSTEVESPDGVVRVSTVGMREFAVAVAAGMRQWHTVQSFSALLERLGTELVSARLQATMRLRMELMERELETRVLRP
jgi:hypothetical protein